MMRGVFCFAPVLLAIVAGPIPARAEFHVWVDAAGHRHVSNIPAWGFAADGSLRRGGNPNSFVFQHRLMLQSLEIRERELAELREAAERAETVANQIARAPVPHAGPREGVMNLDELIALEKRGGRWAAPSPDQGSVPARSK